MQELLKLPAFGDRDYRYTLRRALFTGVRMVNFVMLNPSTADEWKDDPTIRRCWRFANAWRFDALLVTNLFAYRATSPVDMKAAADPIGPRNDEFLRLAASESELVVAAWGVHGAHLGRADEVIRSLARVKTLHHIGLTKMGHPRHPLYVRRDTKPVPFGGIKG